MRYNIVNTNRKHKGNEGSHMASENTESVNAMAKIASRFMELIKWSFGSRRTKELIDANTYGIERAIELGEKYTGYNFSYSNGKITVSDSKPEELIARARNRILAEAVKKQINCERVLMLAANEAQQSESVSDKPLDEDWLTRFFDIVGDVSSEDMQLVWSKILAGEIKQPGKFSLRTLETIRNVSKSEAEMFQKVVPLVMKSGIAPEIRYFVFSNEGILEKYGITYDMVLNLRECGLLSTSESSIGGLVSNPKEHFVAHNDKKTIIIWGKNNVEVNLFYGVHILTRAGSELYSILEHGCNDEYVADFAQKLYEENQNNIQKVTIHNAISDSEYSEEISQSFPS